jgi:hypothetical protein
MHTDTFFQDERNRPFAQRGMRTKISYPPFTNRCWCGITASRVQLQKEPGGEVNACFPLSLFPSDEAVYDY